ncbi:HAD family acid phosphatase [Paracoccus sp. MBLB3053]|uniref:phosphoglycolate phosphatase n=1 Tax=Paracoccus aurantius TaxID=3073814 RepID=A0ABU2HYC0_9RHOB|nr:HAD family acid phosphatase [Paracoccus sp. MBLB3053]MDS9470043.1 HAD family acid phosphatase [Paracoccus sp. MBLB3053]
MNCVIFDVDGTLAHFDAERLGHLVHGVEKFWDEFHREMASTPAIEPIVRLLRHLKAQGEQIVICSGRPEGWENQTAAWLRQENIPFDAIYLRRDDEDALPDPAVKASALERIRSDGFQPWLVVDDRSSVVAFWREAGLTCLQCAPGEF